MGVRESYAKHKKRRPLQTSLCFPLFWDLKTETKSQYRLGKEQQVVVICCLWRHPGLRIDFLCRIHIVESFKFQSQEETFREIVVNTSNQTATQCVSFTFPGVEGGYYFPVVVEASKSIIDFDAGIRGIGLPTCKGMQARRSGTDVVIYPQVAVGLTHIHTLLHFVTGNNRSRIVFSAGVFYSANRIFGRGGL